MAAPPRGTVGTHSIENSREPCVESPCAKAMGQIVPIFSHKDEKNLLLLLFLQLVLLLLCAS